MNTLVSQRLLQVLAGTTAIVTSALIASHAFATTPTHEPKPYARVTESDEGSVTLEMCQRTLIPVDGVGPSVHLISAIHIADASFYQSMQALLETYDAVLFEGVKPAGLDAITEDSSDEEKIQVTKDRLDLLITIAEGYYHTHGEFPKSVSKLIEQSPPQVASIVESIRFDAWGKHFDTRYNMSTKLGEVTENTLTYTSYGADKAEGGQGVNADIIRTSESLTQGKSKSASPEGIQTQLANALHVEFQLDAMDMTKEGWINADIDINELQSQLAEYGEGDAQILKLIEGNSFQAKLIGFVLKFVERSPTMSSMMKLAMIDMLALAESSDMFAQFDAIEKVILVGRNQIVIEYLNKELVANPDAESIAILYGAAHMAGIEETLVTEMGYTFESDSWTPAMTVHVNDTGLSQGQINMMRKMIKNSLEQQF